MSEEGVTYSYAVEPPRPDAGGTGPSPLVAFTGCRIVPINGGLSMLINTVSGKQQLIANDVLSALVNCSQYDSVAGHVARICRLRPDLAARREVIEGTLKQLLQAGILLTAASRLDALREGDACRRAPTRVIVLTADRPATLERLLESLLQSSGLSAHSDLLVIDDSRDAAHAARNREQVEAFNLRSAKTMVYVGPESQAAIAAHLRDALTPEQVESVDFLLARERWAGAPTYGRARSLALLLSVGFRAICLDDDILCRAVASPDQRASLRFGHAGERKAIFYPRWEHMDAEAVYLDTSPLQLHAEVLGRSLAEVTRQTAEIDLAGCEAPMAMQFDGQSRILVSQCGSWGDPGTADPHWALRLQRESLELLASSGSSLGALLEARACWFGCSGPTVMKSPFMSQMTGLDNTQLLPPYFPAFRAEDQLFGSLLNALHPHSAAFEFPWGVPHRPPVERGPGSLRQPVPAAPGLGLVARLVDAQVDYAARQRPEDNLEAVADLLQRYASYSPDALEGEFRAVFALAQGEQFQHLQALKAATGELPAPNWQAYLDRAVEEMQRALQVPQTLVSLGHGSGLDRQQVYERLCNDARGFAGALRAWPAMRDQGPALWDLAQHAQRG
jgi:hypothetical protein